jgi:aspartyl-tRNA(Asn)/glutamyl-tRNA(Gln) amidotransferase subunit A
MARTIADCAALLEGMAGAGPPLTATYPPAAPLGELPTRARAGSRPLAGVTVALTDRTDGLELDPEVAAALDDAAIAAGALGATVVNLRSPWAIDWDDLSTVLFADVWTYHRTLADHRDRYRPAIAEFVEIASRFTDAQAYIDAQRRRAEGAVRWNDWFAAGGVDVVLEPTLPIVPYGRGPGYERGHAGGAGDPMIALTAIWDMTGMPVAALPVTWKTGVSLIGPSGREATLLQVALDLQEHQLGIPPAP